MSGFLPTPKSLSLFWDVPRWAAPVLSLRVRTGAAHLGCTYVKVEYNGQTGQFPLVIVEGSGPTLLGRDWLSQIKLDW